jgi:hypothetical protein
MELNLQPANGNFSGSENDLMNKIICLPVQSNFMDEAG